MANTIPSAGNALFNVLAQDNSGQRSRLAQYALMQAGELLKSDRKDDAIKAFQRALAFEPNNATALEYIGNIQLSRNNNAEAIKAFQQLAKSQPDSADAQMKLGNAYLQDKQYAESEKAYQKAARIEPLNPLPEYTLGLQYLNTDRLQEAETQLLRVQRMAPRDGNVYYGLGSLYNKQGKHEEAVAALEAALVLKPEFPAANYELGMAYLGLGQDEEAKAQLRLLNENGSPFALDLGAVLNKPQISWMDTSNSKLNVSLGARTPLWILDPVNLTTPGATAQMSVTIKFSNEMDMASVTNPSNWTITKAKGGVEGYYNNSVFASADGNEAKVSSAPVSVTYNAVTQEANVTFLVSQNSTGDATIDPRHLVFTFSGKDEAGRSMDTSADAIDGYATKAF